MLPSRLLIPAYQSVPKRRWSSIDQNFASDSPVEVNGLRPDGATG